MAEKERAKIKQRYSEGIATAKLKGKHLGRPKAKYPLSWQTYYNRWKDSEITAKQCMEEMNLKRTTFYKLVKQYEEETE